MTRFRNSLSKSRSRSSTPESQPKTPKVETPDQQARHLIGRHLALRTSRHEWKSAEKIHGKRTADHHRQTLARASTYMQQMGHDQGLRDMTEDYFREYLESRAPGLTTKNLGYEATLLRRYVPRLRYVKRPGIRGQKEPTRLSTEPRAYTRDEINRIADVQKAIHALTTYFMAGTGCRVREVLTLARPEEQPADERPQYKPERFEGLGEGAFYTKIGKGGLRQTIFVQQHLVPAIEAMRLPKPVERRDRYGVVYTQYYGLVGGSDFSRAFTAAAKAVLGENGAKGTHGLRHFFAQARMVYHQEQGRSAAEARELVSQAVGHFRPSITKTYLR